MISTEELFLASMEMRKDHRLVRDAASALEHVYASESYSEWRGTLGEKEPYVLPLANVPEALTRAGFVDGRTLRVKVNRMAGAVFVTDGVWVDPAVRVFPFCDESETLLRYVASQKLDQWADVVVDLATGCGHSAIGIKRVQRRIGYDINPRAISYATLNRMMNDMSGSHLYLGLNDIRDGIPKIASQGRSRRTLFVANMPFAPAPADRNVPMTTNGGRMGTDLQQATFAAISEFAAVTDGEVRLCMLGVTPGDRVADKWDFVDKARDGLPAAKNFSWKVLGDEKIFRVDGVRQIDNPAGVVEALSRFGSCRLYYGPHQQPAVRQGFEDLGKSIERAGSPDLAYGVVEAAL